MMQQTRRKSYLTQILIAEAVGILSGILSKGGMEQFQLTAVQPDISPSSLVFPFVWTLLYALMGISITRILHSDPKDTGHSTINLYIIQLVVNFFWSLIFFNAQEYGGAFLWLLLLWILVFLMTVRMYRTDKLAGLLQLPYLIWLTFAAYLNYAVWQLNK